MNFFFVKISFIVIIFICYIAGIYIGKFFQYKLDVNIDFKLLLPVISMVFYNDFIRSMSHLLVNIKIIEKSYYNNQFKYKLKIELDRSKQVELKIKTIYNNCNSHIFIKDNRDNDARKIPENFSMYIGKDKRVAIIDIYFHFKDASKLRYKLPFTQYSLIYFNPKIVFLIRKKCKSIKLRFISIKK